MKLLLPFVLTLLLASCGGGSPTPAVEPPAVTPVVVTKTPVRVCLYGDSTQVWNSHAGLLEALPAGSEVKNFGRAGLTAWQHLNGVPGFIPNWYTSIRSDGCDLVVQNYGINDALKLFTDPNVFADQVMSMRQMALDAGLKVVIESPNPILAHQPALLAAYAEALRARLAGDITFADQNLRIQQELPSWQSHLPDGYHPDEVMYAFKTSVLIEAVGKNIPTKP